MLNCLHLNTLKIKRMDGRKLRIMTLNVRGLRNPTKFNAVLNYAMEKHHVDILCVQETYFTEDSTSYIRSLWKGKHFHSFTNSSHSRGVSVFFRTDLDIKLVNKHSCSEGRKLMINFEFKNELFTVVNIYAPNNLQHRIDFFKRIGKWIRQNAHTENNLVICGDMNSILTSMGRSSGNMESCSKHFQHLLKFTESYDSWSQLNPNKLGYTYYGSKVLSRIDYILASKHAIGQMKNLETKIAPVPDHKSVIVTIYLDSRKRGKGYWKLNNSHLQDECFVAELERIVDETLTEYEMCLSKKDLWDLCKIRFKEFAISYGIKKANQLRTLVSVLEKQIADIDNEIERTVNKDSHKDSLLTPFLYIYCYIY